MGAQTVASDRQKVGTPALLHTHRCRACGQVIPPEIALPPMQERIYNAVRKAPISAEALRDLLWGHRAINPHTIYAHVHFLNQKLKQHKLAIRGTRHGDYHLVSL